MNDRIGNEAQKTNEPKIERLIRSKSRIPGLRLLNNKARIEEIDWMAAAIAKCEAVIQSYKNDEMLKPLIISEWKSTIRASKMTDGINQLLYRLMAQESLFEPYLKEADGNAMLALALAKSEVAQLEKLRSLGWSSRTELIRKAQKTLLLPIILIAVTALFGSIVGTLLQEASFQRTHAFELRLTTLRKSQEEAASWLIKVRDIYNQIKSDEQSYIKAIRAIEAKKSNTNLNETERIKYDNKLEDYANHSWVGDITKLQDLEKDLTRMSSLSAGIDKQHLVSNAAELANEEIRSFISCLKRDKWDWNSPCALTPNLTPYQAFVTSYSDAIEKLLKEK